MHDLDERYKENTDLKHRGLNKHEVEIMDEYPPIEAEKGDMKVTWFQKMWMKINGTKTLIGGCVVAAGTQIPGFWGIVVKAVGAVIAFIGTIHKTKKIGDKLNSKTSGDKINWVEIITIIFNLIKQFINKKKEKK